jgi:hypothetical protein
MERLILEGRSRREIEEWYSLVDVLDDNESLDLKYEAERRANEAVEAKSRMSRGRR